MGPLYTINKVGEQPSFEQPSFSKEDPNVSMTYIQVFINALSLICSATLYDSCSKELCIHHSNSTHVQLLKQPPILLAGERNTYPDHCAPRSMLPKK